MTAHTKDNPPTRPRPKGIWLIFAVVLAILLGSTVFWLAGPRLAGSLHPIAVETPIEPAPVSSGPPWFRDMTAASGLHFTYRNGEEADHFAILETLGGGVALLDYDGDGRLDVFVTGGGSFSGPSNQTMEGRPCKLYRNLGAWKFQDVTAEAGLGRTWFYSHGAAVADYDRDGWPDLLVTGYGQLALFHNESDGKDGRRFVEVTQKLGLRDHSWCTSAGWADLDGDGWADLYVCHYDDWSLTNNPICKGQSPGVKRDRCTPGDFKPQRHSLFRNEEGKSFRDVSVEHGFRAAGNGLGIVLVDLNDDRRPDIYVANDTNNNFLFLNRGGGKLEEKAVLAGVGMDENGRANGSMGVDAGDYDGSGRPSLWVTVFQNEVQALYRNLGGEIFQHQSQAAGIVALGKHLVSFGTGFMDLDNDGWEDLVIVSGHVYRFPAANTLKQKPVLLRNVEYQGRRFFEDVSARGGDFFQTPAVGRGVAIGDLDNDGWPDLVISHTNTPVVLLRNEAAASSPNPVHWLGVRLIGRERRDVVGSTVVLEEEGGRRLTRFVKGGGGYLSANDPRILFGLGSSGRVRRLSVKWSWGETQSLDNLEPDHYWELHEGRAEAKRISLPGD